MTGFTNLFSDAPKDSGFFNEGAVVYAPENAFPHMLSVSLPGLWGVELASELLRLQTLETGWDGYGSPAIDPIIAHSAYNILSALERTIRENRALSIDLSCPFLVPVPGGGLQAEWHFEDYFVEIFFDRDNKTEASFYSEGIEVDPIDESTELIFRGANVDASTLISWFKRIEDAKLPVREAA